MAMRKLVYAAHPLWYGIYVIQPNTLVCSASGALSDHLSGGDTTREKI